MILAFDHIPDNEVFQEVIQVLQKRMNRRKFHQFIFPNCKKCSYERGLIKRLREMKGERNGN